MYFINYAETEIIPTTAKTLESAKRAASENCLFEGQTVRVFEGSDPRCAILVAVKYADPINMGKRAPWVEVAKET